ncbi:hypothetical protein B0O99DRAFT_610307 [Bisporella sp. PMI_857]|nr:hypothetical protein B0O99DRAFT_612899 [Bisporella sp. PMI_857]KAH8600264.1 hypothetical protein B0O99DRAFT_610307 [Bisporella sp. PMI_857]
MANTTPLTVLTSSDIQDLLGDLNRDEIEHMQQSLRNALHEYSTGNQDNPECFQNQQDRMVTENDNGTTTLVMPARSSSGVSMKVVTLAPPEFLSVHRNAFEQQSINSSPQGSLTLMDNGGNAYAFMNAGELTAFRTALASSLLIVRRRKVKAITVFGSGKQAFWHLRLALLFHGKTIEHVYIHNHSLSKTSKTFFKAFVGYDNVVKKEEGWHNTRFSVLSPSYAEYHRLLKGQLRASDIIICATPAEAPLFEETILTNPSGRIKGRLIIAVGSYKPGMIELPPAILKQAVKHHGSGLHFRKRAAEGGCILVDTTRSLRQTGELIQSELQMNHIVEIGEIVMLVEQFAHEMDEENDESVIDDNESIDFPSGLGHSGMSSMASALSEITNSSRRSSRRSSKASLRSESESTNSSWISHLSFQKRRHDLNDHHKKKHSKDEEEMTEWLARGNVIYKSVGLGLVDLVVGDELVRFAREKGYGITVDDF